MSEIVRFNSKSAILTGGSLKLEVGATETTFHHDVTIPTTANYVVVRADANASTTASVCARFYTTTDSPTASSGIPIGNLDVLVFTKDQFANLSFISVDANTQVLYFQWFQV